MKFYRTLGALLLFAISLSFAQNDMNPPPNASGMRGRMLRQLKLTEEQQKSIGDLRLELRKKSVQQQARIKTAQLDLAELFRADQPNQSSIQKKISEISQLRTEQRLLIVDQWFAVNKLLTPEQQKIWKKASGQLLAQQRSRLARGRDGAMLRNQRNWNRQPDASQPSGR